MTGREFLTHEGYKETEEEADGEDVDLIALMKAKKQEEEALDEVLIISSKILII